MRNNYFKKWKNDFEFRTIVNSFASSGITVIFALYNLVIGIYYGIIWNQCISVYYILLTILRGLISYGASKYDKTDKAGRKKYTLRHRLI